MGANIINNQNVVLNNQNEEIIEYQGYEEFPIEKKINNILTQQEKIRPNPSLNNHSGGSSIGKYESDHGINKDNQNIVEDVKNNNIEQNDKLRGVPNNSNQNNNIQEQTKQNEPIQNSNNEIANNKENNDNNIQKREENNLDKKEDENKIEEQKNDIKQNEENNDIKDKDNLKEEENQKNNNITGKEENIKNEEPIKNEEENNKITQNDINIDNKNNENNIENNIDTNEIKNENQEQANLNDNLNENNNKEEEEKKNEIEENKNKNDEFAPRKIILPNINTIISEKVLEEGAGNELLFMSNLNKVVHISIKERVRYGEKFCITTKDNFLIYETRENYIKVKKPLAIIPINTIKNVVLFKLTKKVINYDHFYIEFQLNEENRNNVYNQVDTFYINDLDNTSNENKSNTALVMFKTEEKNLAKKWYVLLKYLVELKLKN